MNKLTVAQAAKIAGCTNKNIYKAIELGLKEKAKFGEIRHGLKTAKFGNVYAINPEDLQAWLEAKRNVGQPRKGAASQVELGRMVGVCDTTISNWLRGGKLPAQTPEALIQHMLEGGARWIVERGDVLHGVSVSEQGELVIGHASPNGISWRPVVEDLFKAMKEVAPLKDWCAVE